MLSVPEDGLKAHCISFMEPETWILWNQRSCLQSDRDGIDFHSSGGILRHFGCEILKLQEAVVNVALTTITFMAFSES